MFEGTELVEKTQLEFRLLESGDYFPPIVPDGDFFAYTYARRMFVRMFSINQQGLYANGIFLEWTDITGVSISGSTCRIHTEKYRAGGFQFDLGGCELRRPGEKPLVYQQGYSVDYCLLNRITFELQRMPSGRG